MIKKISLVALISIVLVATGLLTGAYYLDSENITNNEFSTGSWGQVEDNDLDNIIITEFMANPAAVNDSVGEWFEIYNPTDHDINLFGWRYRQNNGLDLTEITSQLIITSKSYMVFGKNLDSSINGGVSMDYQMANNFNLNNNSDSIIIEKPNGNTYDIIDQVIYDKDGYIISSGKSNILMDLSQDNSVPNNWGQSTTSFGDGDLGSPGGPNV